MKKFLLIFFAIVFLFSAFSCAPNDLPGDESSSESASEPSSSESSSGGDIVTPPVIKDPVTDAYSIMEMGAPYPYSTASHGGNQTRIVRTSHGVYAAYLSGEDYVVIRDEEYYEYSLVKIDIETGACTEIKSGLLYHKSNSVYVMADRDENVYVVCGDCPTIDDYSYVDNIIWKYDPTSGEVTVYEARYDVPRISGGYGYAMGFIDNYTDQIYIVHCGGDRLGKFAISRFDIKTGTFVGIYDFDIPGRHCYLIANPDGKGGFTVVAQHCVTVGATGNKGMFFNGGYWARYVWDDIRIFHFTIDSENELILSETVDIDLVEYFEGTGLFPQNLYYRNGDVFFDQSGNLHVLYRNSFDHGKCEITEYHVVYDSDLNEIYREPIVFDDTYIQSEFKMYQTTEGVFYIIALPKRFNIDEIHPGDPEGMGEYIYPKTAPLVQVYRSVDGYNFEKVYEEVFEGEDWVAYSAVAGQPRNGSLIDNTVSIMTSVMHGDDWYYFEVDLDAIEALLQQNN